MEGTVKVDGKHLAPFGGRHLLRLLADVYAGVIDQNIKPAKQLDCGLHHPRTGIHVPDIECKCRSHGSSLAELRRGVLGFCNIAAAYHDAGTSLRETTRYAKANAAIAAGNDSDLALEI